MFMNIHILHEKCSLLSTSYDRKLCDALHCRERQVCLVWLRSWHSSRLEQNWPRHNKTFCTRQRYQNTELHNNYATTATHINAPTTLYTTHTATAASPSGVPSVPGIAQRQGRTDRDTKTLSSTIGIPSDKNEEIDGMMWVDRGGPVAGGEMKRTTSHPGSRETLPGNGNSYSTHRHPRPQIEKERKREIGSETLSSLSLLVSNKVTRGIVVALVMKT